MPSTAYAPDLTGRVVLVTGAGRGLGRALVRRLSSSGAHAAGCARSASELASLAAELDAASSPPLLMAIDVTDPAAVERLVDAVVERWGRVDGLINNAAVLGERRPLRDIEPDAWRRVIDVNLTGAFNMCRAGIRAMRGGGGGSIVNVSSGVGDQPRAEWGPYAVSKWALEGLSWNLALEERAAGIRVNVVDPGRMRTAMRRAAYPAEDPETLPEPVAATDVFLWLMDAASAGTTGQRLNAQDWTPPS